MKNLKNNRSGQLFIISSFLLILSLVFIYSQETQNSYIVHFTDSIIIEDIIYESCEIGYTSNGTFIESRFSSFENYINLDCQNNFYNCQLTITKQIAAPTNLSLLDFTHFDFELSYDSQNVNYSNQYIC